MDKPKIIRTETISFKTTKLIREKLEQMAEKGNRSLSREIELLIRAAPLEE